MIILRTGLGLEMARLIPISGDKRTLILERWMLGLDI
jgi:hypothetical protein